MRYALILAFATRLAAATEHDPAEVLSRVTGKVMASIRHIPNYTCVETVSRQYFRPAGNSLPRACKAVLESRQHPALDMVLHPFATDRLRLDVAMTQHGEIFSWAGASKFDDELIDHLVRSGPMGTGAFGAFISMIFESDAAKLAFGGSRVVRDRSLFEYSFWVTKAESHYTVKVDNSWIRTAYSGAIQVDPETDDLVGITLQTAELPPASGECFSVINLEFGMLQIGNGSFLLPRLSHQRFVSPTGVEVENTTDFENCREYLGESTMSFEEPPPMAGTPAGGTPEKTTFVPAGSRFSFELTQPISSDVAAAGDRFVGRLIQPLRDTRQKVLAPKGTVVEGRLMRVASFHKPAEVIVVLRPDALEINGSKVPVTAVLDWSQKMATARIEDRKKMVFTLPQQGEEHSGLFRFPGEHAKIPRGFQSSWQTVSTK